MKIFFIKLQIFLIFLLINSKEIKCKDSKDESEVKQVKLDIVGDTSHLFSEEDFKKEEVILLSDKEESKDIENSTEKFTNKTDKSSSKSKKCSFSKTNRTENYVQLVNGSALTTHLSDSEETECFLVLFYVPWCPFCIRLAPIYNALPRAFINLDILAFDVSNSYGYNTKFGTSAVPIILLFQHKSVLKKFNYTEKTLIDYIDFVSNHTSLAANRSIIIEENDLNGPVPTVIEKTFDYYLFFSWLFIIFISFDFLIRKTRFGVILNNLYKKYFLRPRQIQQGPQRHMIETNEQHPHID